MAATAGSLVLDEGLQAPSGPSDFTEPNHLQIAPGNSGDASPCYPVNLPLTLRYSGAYRRRTAVDVSDEGMFVESPDHVPIGELVQVLTNLPDGEVLRVLCSVERVVMAEEAAFCGGMPGMGLRFLLMDSVLENRWGRFLHSVENGIDPLSPDPAAREHFREPPLRLSRREQTRRPARFRVRMRSQQSLKDFYTENVSRGGMFIATPNPFSPGSQVQLFVVHPVSGREVSLQGEVRWFRKEGPEEDRGMGVQLVGEDGRAEQMFLEFMNGG